MWGHLHVCTTCTCPPFPAPPGGTGNRTHESPRSTTAPQHQPSPRSGPALAARLWRLALGAWRIWAWPSAFPTGILPNSDPSPPRSKTRWSCCGALLGLQGESARWVAAASCAGCSTSSRHLRAESCPAAPRPHRPRAHPHSKTAESPRVVERRRAERRVGCRRRRPNRLLHHARGCRAA